MATTTPLVGAGNVTTSSNGASKTITISKPANLADGHYMFAAIMYRNVGGTWTVPSGWTEIDRTAQDYVDMRVYYKYVPSASAESATDYTWSTNQTAAADRIAGMIWLQQNADTTSVIDAYGNAQTTQPNRTSMNLAAVTAIDPSPTLICVVYDSIAGSSTAPVSSTPSGMSEITNIGIANAVPNALNLKVTYQILGTSGTTGIRSVTFSPAAAGSGGFMFTITPGSGPSAPVLLLMRQGLPDTDRVRAVAKTLNVTNHVRMVVSTASDLSVSPIYSDYETPDADGYTHHEVTGLTADTPYYYGMELDDVLYTANIGNTRTFQTSGSPKSFSFLAASCTNTGSNNAVFDQMRTRVGPDSLPARFFRHLGDVHYQHASYQPVTVAPNDPVDHRTNYEMSLSAPRQSQLWRDIPVTHTYSDNDFCGTNSDSTSIGRPAIITVRHQILSDPPLPDSQGNGLWNSFAIGRVRFISTDSRTYMAAKGMADTSAKSVLGAEQKAWFKARLLDPEPLKIWFHDNQWAGAPVAPSTGYDNWQVFNTERTELGNFIYQNDINVIYIHGDSHRLTADSGLNNAYGGFPTISVAPMDFTGRSDDSTENWSEDTYPPVSAGQISLTNYGWFDVIDDGVNITLAFKGYDGTGTLRVQMTRTWPGTKQFRGWGQRI